MKKTHLMRLQSEIETEWSRLEMLVQELQQLVANLPAHAEPSHRDKAAIGAFLHSFYNGIENILKHLVREIDQNVPRGEGWHRALLQRMSVAVPGIRSAILRPDTVIMLEPYLGFRHFFRHAYTFEIDWNKLQPLITHVAVVLKQVRADISAFFEAQLNPGARGKEF